MPRPKTFDKQDVLDRAVDLFRARGFDGASVPELTTHLGICRQALYSSFGDKRGLYLEALDLYGTREIDSKLAHLAAAASPLEGIRSLVAAWGEVANQCPSDGCLTVNAIIDSTADEGARTIVEGHVERLEKGLKGALKRAQVAGELTPEAQPARLARSLVATCYGIGVLCKLPSSGQRVKAAVAEAQDHLSAFAT